MSVLFIPILPESLNVWSRAHWSVRHRERDRWRDAVALACCRSHPEPMRGPYSLRLTFYWPDRRRHDAANGEKLVSDALVHARLIPDDGPPMQVDLSLRSRLATAPDRVGVMVQMEPEDAPAWPLPIRRKRPAQESGATEIARLRRS